MHGYGYYEYVDGTKYKGQFWEDKKHGFGEYIWKNNRSYVGYWLNGKQHGLGIYYSETKEPRYGLWESGKKLQWFDQAEVSKIKQGEYEFEKSLNDSVMSF